MPPASAALLADSPFPAARYRFEARVETSLYLPEYAGSALRGAFGHALRRIACLTREKNCKACPLYRSCPYPAIFEPPPPPEHPLQRFSEIPAPFVVEPPPWGERHYSPGASLVFHLVLMGRSLDQLPLIVFAWQRALERGVGRGDGIARLQQVWQETGPGEQALVFDAQAGQVMPHAATLPPLDDGLAQVRQLELHFTTPLRIQQEGRPLGPDSLNPRAFLMALVRRVALISEFHLGQPLALDFTQLAQQAAGVTARQDLAWRDWGRYSNRQRQEMKLGGCIGHWTLGNNLTPFLPFLHLGHWLHVGKNTSFGLGQYTIMGWE